MTAAGGQVLERKLCQLIVVEEEPFELRQTGKRSRLYFLDIIASQISANDSIIIKTQSAATQQSPILTVSASAVDRRTSSLEPLLCG